MFFTLKMKYYFSEDILLNLVSFRLFLLLLVTICLLCKVFVALCTHVHAPWSHIDASMANMGQVLDGRRLAWSLQ
jgi:hypothetical protein